MTLKVCFELAGFGRCNEKEVEFPFVEFQTTQYFHGVGTVFCQCTQNHFLLCSQMITHVEIPGIPMSRTAQHQISRTSSDLFQSLMFGYTDYNKHVHKHDCLQKRSKHMNE